MGLGAAALWQLLARDGEAAPAQGILGAPHHPPRAKRIIYLFMSGGPSQHDLFDYKPLLNERNGQDLPASVRMGQRLTGMSAHQATFPLAGSIFKFARHGKSGAWLSDLMPWTAKVADELCFVKSMFTEAINHDPAVTFFQTGSQLAGRPSMGAWLSYGLGTECDNLPAFVVLTSFGTGRKDDQPLYDRLWGSGFLPTEHQGVKFRNAGDPVLYIGDPPGVDRTTRREMLDDIAGLNKLRQAVVGDPEISTRISAYELAFRM